MRTSINIPDEYAKKIKSSLPKKGFNTLNEYILKLIRDDAQQIDATKIIMKGDIAPIIHTPLHKAVMEIEVEDKEWPSTFLGKPLSGRTQDCPICYKSVPVEFAQSHYSKQHGDI